MRGLKAVAVRAGNLRALHALVAVAAASFSAYASPTHGAEPAPAVEADSSAGLFLPEHAQRMVLNNDIQATWIGATSLLWYKIATDTGWSFWIADPAAGTRRPAFDHKGLAAALGRALGARQNEAALPISSLGFPQGLGGSIRVTVGNKSFDCAPSRCAERSEPAAKLDRSYSPDGRIALFNRDHNLWSEDLATGETRPLTRDGSRLRAYAAHASMMGAVFRSRRGIATGPLGQFSPDGKYFLTFRLDESASPTTTLIEHAPADPAARPAAHSYPAAYVGEPAATAQLLLVEVRTGKIMKIKHPAGPLGLIGPIALAEAKWSQDSRAFYFTDYRDLFRTRALFRGDPATGETAEVIADKAATNQYSFVNPDWHLLSNGDILWPSERSGWQQLYLHDANGMLKNAVTSGAWVVREILLVDERTRSVTISAGGRENGRDPYLRHIYRAPLEGQDLRPLATEDADHEVRIPGTRETPTGKVETKPGFSADGSYFIDAYSRIDLPTETVVRRASDGRVVMKLATASHSGTVPAFDPPEAFEAIAADGKTKTYGIIMKPSDFDPSRRYPVIDTMYAGPQSIFVPKRFGWEMVGTFGRDLAALGFVVVVVDGRGLPWRSRAFLDEGYGKMGKAGFLEDHVAAIRQLASTRPWMDLSRVGANGYSAGGFSAVHALMDYPDFYKVGVAIAPYDPLINDWVWAARFQGTTDPKQMLPELSYRNAAQFKGRLLLMHGDLDDVADPSSTMRIANALIRENKKFDMLIVPGADHWVALDRYVVQRRWDYFVENLLRADPASTSPTAPGH